MDSAPAPLPRLEADLPGDPFAAPFPLASAAGWPDTGPPFRMRHRLRRVPAPPRGLPSRRASGMAGLGIGLAGALALGSQGLALPERPVSTSLRLASLVPALPVPGSAEPVVLAPDRAAELREAFAAELSDAPYSGPRPASVVFAPASGEDRERALTCLTQAIYYEAGTESEAGQRAVAQVVLNRVRHPAYPNSVCGVVYQGSERPTGCQFTFTCDGALARRPLPALWLRARRYAAEALDGRAFGEVGYATHYHTFEVWPRWGRTLTMTNMIGRHLFHRLPGAAGGPGAFTMRYAGHEPAPREWRPQPVSDGEAASAAGAATAEPPPMSYDPAPAADAPVLAERDDGLPQSRAIEGALPDSTVRPEFRDSGRWIGG